MHGTGMRKGSELSARNHKVSRKFIGAKIGSDKSCSFLGSDRR